MGRSQATHTFCFTFALLHSRGKQHKTLAFYLPVKVMRAELGGPPVIGDLTVQDFP